jgi:hypothetical protein
MPSDLLIGLRGLSGRQFFGDRDHAAELGIEMLNAIEIDIRQAERR